MHRFFACAIVSLGLASAASAQIADYQNDFTPSGPAGTGWSFYTSTTLGNAAQYVPLTRDASNNFSLAGGGAGNLAATSTSLVPGLGSTQNNGTPQYVIAAYQVQPGDLASGNIGFLDNYRFALAYDPAADGVSAAVYKNDQLLIPIDMLPSGIDYNSSAPDAYPLPLGPLSVGDTIYVAIGPRGTNVGDVLQVDYSIVVPEPAALSTIALAAGALLARRRRRS